MIYGFSISLSIIISVTDSSVTAKNKTTKSRDGIIYKINIVLGGAPKKLVHSLSFAV